LNAVARYKKLIRSYASIEQIIPSEYVASYLGMVPQSLSRVKRKLNRD
jgi:CRP/FNR family transcriptional regulator, anaerobic regulatory protein